jgi:hypothetical protein
MLRAHAVIVVMIMLAGGVAGVTADLSEEHSIDIVGSMSIPTQTVKTGFGEAAITEIGKKEAGETLEISTDVPENESYAIRIVEIVDGDRRILESEFVEGDVERSFFLDRYDPGTYVVALTKNGADDIVEVEPFVVKKYAVNQSAGDVTKGQKITVDIQLTEVSRRGDGPQAVNVTLHGSGVVRFAKGIKTGENIYRANFSSNKLPVGSYDIYSGVETDDDIFNYTELVGVSDPISVTIKTTETPTPTPPPSSNPTPTPTPTSTPTPTPTPITNTSVNITRSVSSSEITSGTQLIVTTIISGVNGSAFINSSYNPPVKTAAIQSVVVNNISADPITTEASVNGSTVTMSDIKTEPKATIIVTEKLTIGDDTGAVQNITGNVTTGDTTVEIGLKSVTVTESAPIVNEYDADGNGKIGIIELGTAGADFARGELTITELGQIGAAFAS